MCVCVYAKIHFIYCTLLYIWLMIYNPFPANCHSSRIKHLFRESFANSMFIFRGAMLGNNSSYEDSIITCQITPNYHG